MRIEIWSDVVCPWCYVGKRRLERALADFEHAEEVEVVYRSFELDPSAPHHGHELTTGVIARRYGSTEAQMRESQQQLIDLAAEEGLAMRLFENVHTSTVDAHRLLHLALAEGGPPLQRELKEALLAAYFLRAEDVGDHAVLRAAAVAAGLADGRVDQVLAGTEYADAVEARRRPGPGVRRHRGAVLRRRRALRRLGCPADGGVRPGARAGVGRPDADDRGGGRRRRGVRTRGVRGAGVALTSFLGQLSLKER